MSSQLQWNTRKLGGNIPTEFLDKLCFCFPLAHNCKNALSAGMSKHYCNPLTFSCSVTRPHIHEPLNQNMSLKDRWSLRPSVCKGVLLFVFWYCCSFTQWIQTNLLARFKVHTVLRWYACTATDTICASPLNNLFTDDLKLLVGIINHSSVFSLLQVLLDGGAKCFLPPQDQNVPTNAPSRPIGTQMGGKYICHFNNVGSGHENDSWSLGQKPALAMHHTHLVPGTRWQPKTHSWLQKQKKSPPVDWHFPQFLGTGMSLSV